MMHDFRRGIMRTTDPSQPGDSPTPSPEQPAGRAEYAAHGGEFLAALAHELLNPLAPIRNALHVLRLRGDHAPTREWARDVLDRQVAHLTRLVHRLHEVSRLARGKVALQRERVD